MRHYRQQHKHDKKKEVGGRLHYVMRSGERQPLVVVVYVAETGDASTQLDNFNAEKIPVFSRDSLITVPQGYACRRTTFVMGWC